ncbi:Glycine dehydrogenase [decarboxylating] (glycine cleavage system P protein) (EC [Bathymodiolus thermophilus thioautotrophic gill symbiont]|uniref:Glycine dehydrogenase (decarboxylating) n=1 Tax=Bathymodiolus thermophilus thioautotrophic gill symbiont TaxID=2360 RepID=A0A1J5U6A5_9GAMM|nr:aminomethyl-transferring glycine dehydrogenase [Bathymodiolus thermophilus thioautotrophic gill symbiont]OIR23937.1 glycine dehydrogenase (aminomethyl-transferring) [Bathymodiolus thermophilus thioautotrophic gill symbiont]CAB5496719.1 Glycine dehydrogenase [decarboxylating] (glycine cleavage system P protein) (EC [Bathymodiolus thermophilus thioautotrophic gill symbiont]
MSNEFLDRHLGPNEADIASMLRAIGQNSIDEVISKTVPEGILFGNQMALNEGLSERDALALATQLAAENIIATNFIGQGYYGTLMPSVIQRNILENPGWYTAYTPYQAEISQGRLEMLLNFQQMIVDLTGMDISNASLLDEPTAAAEAMMMAKRANRKNKSNKFLIDTNTHPQTITILQTRAKPLGIELVVKKIQDDDFSDCFAVLMQSPGTNGEVRDLTADIDKAKSHHVLTIVACDILALCLIKTPAEMGADIAIGNSQRFGVPMGFGGPHAAFLATKDEFKRMVPGRIIGVSQDVLGNPAMRMSLQTREQHIRRDKATSNICTAQVLLAVLAAAYGIYHGAKGLKKIATKVHLKAVTLANSLTTAGFQLENKVFFDTLTINTNQATTLFHQAQDQGINCRLLNNTQLTIAIDESTTTTQLSQLASIFDISLTHKAQNSVLNITRSSTYLTHPVFSLYHSETEMMRYLKRLENKDIALNHSMIALGSCTMKLNAATQMYPISLPGFSSLHPYAPAHQTKGYQQLFKDLEYALAEITGYDAVSLQPNAGSQGEFAGLLAIHAYHDSRGDSHRNICLIPSSAHGTNPASAVMAGMQVVIVKCDESGNIDIDDLQTKAEKYADNLAAIMVTYPSTHGVFEVEIQKICDIIHAQGAQVYLDGANLNAMVGITRMGEFGADVSHINLHKTFAIPHGGGGPGMGPIGVKAHLAPFLPGNPLEKNSNAVSAAMFGSASILPISWSYIKLLGKQGMQRSTEIAILSANYIANELKGYFPILYRGDQGLVAHECIVDIRPLKEKSSISEEDIAKRLMDYGFHSPTMSFPVAGTLMIEPTESESKREIDRFITAMISIYAEIQKVISGEWDKDNNPLKNAPHTALEMAEDWHYPYSRTTALYPVESLKQNKYFPPVKRIDNVYGDRNLFCTCPDITEFEGTPI